jgi:hypothetical protein
VEGTQFAPIYGAVEQEDIGFYCIRGQNIDFYIFGVAQNSTSYVKPLFPLVSVSKKRRDV